MILSRPHRSPSGFTLIELLVVVAIIAILLAITFPAFSGALDAARLTACMSNQQQIGRAIGMYAADHDGHIPVGPKVTSYPLPNDFYRHTGFISNLVSHRTGAPVGLGLLFDKELANTPEVVFCPGTDQPVKTAEELAKVGTSQVQGSYLYRHGSVINATSNPQTRLDRLGDNRNGDPIRALVMDGNLLVGSNNYSFNVFGIVTRTHHETKRVNTLYVDGHVSTLDNRDARLTVDVAANPYGAPDRMLETLETADIEY